MLDTGAPSSGGNILGYDFLQEFGVFGINQRTHRFILYHYAAHPVEAKPPHHRNAVRRK